MSQINASGDLSAPVRATRVVTPVGAPQRFDPGGANFSGGSFFSQGEIMSRQLGDALSAAAGAVTGLANITSSQKAKDERARREAEDLDQKYAEHIRLMQESIGAAAARRDAPKFISDINSGRVPVPMSDDAVVDMTDNFINNRTDGMTGLAREAYRKALEPFIDQHLYAHRAQQVEIAKDETVRLTTELALTAKNANEAAAARDKLLNSGFKITPDEATAATLLEFAKFSAIAGKEDLFKQAKGLIGDKFNLEMQKFELTLKATIDDRKRLANQALADYSASISNQRTLGVPGGGPLVPFDAQGRMVAGRAADIGASDDRLAIELNQIQTQARADEAMLKITEQENERILRNYADSDTLSRLGFVPGGGPFVPFDVQIERVNKKANELGVDSETRLQVIGQIEAERERDQRDTLAAYKEYAKQQAFLNTAANMTKFMENGANSGGLAVFLKGDSKAVVDTEYGPADVNLKDAAEFAVNTKMAQIDAMVPEISSPANIDLKLQFLQNSAGAKNPQWEAEMADAGARVDATGRATPALERAVDLYHKLGANPIVRDRHLKDTDREFLRLVDFMRYTSGLQVDTASAVAAIRNVNSVSSLQNLQNKPLSKESNDQILLAVGDDAASIDVVSEVTAVANAARIYFPTKFTEQAAVDYAIKRYEEDYTKVNGFPVKTFKRELIKSMDQKAVTDSIVGAFKFARGDYENADLTIGPVPYQPGWWQIIDADRVAVDENKYSDETLGIIDSYVKGFEQERQKASDLEEASQRANARKTFIYQGLNVPGSPYRPLAEVFARFYPTSYDKFKPGEPEQPGAVDQVRPILEYVRQTQRDRSKSPVESPIQTKPIPGGRTDSVIY